MPEPENVGSAFMDIQAEGRANDATTSSSIDNADTAVATGPLAEAADDPGATTSTTITAKRGTWKSRLRGTKRGRSSDSVIDLTIDSSSDEADDEAEDEPTWDQVRSVDGDAEAVHGRHGCTSPKSKTGRWMRCYTKDRVSPSLSRAVTSSTSATGSGLAGSSSTRKQGGGKGEGQRRGAGGICDSHTPGSSSGTGRKRPLSRVRGEPPTWDAEVVEGRPKGPLRYLDVLGADYGKDLRFPCTACGRRIGGKQPIFWHPLLTVPICESCSDTYNAGEFIVDTSHETYCRWCGDGGNICCCDTCNKSFCEKCIRRNLGQRDLLRIFGQSDLWLCILCNPKPLKRLWRRMAGAWGAQALLLSSEHDGIVSSSSIHGWGVICEDISRGQEPVAIPVINEYDDTPAPDDLTFVSDVVWDDQELTHLSSNPNWQCSCDCEDNCEDPMKCGCARLMGKQFPYTSKGRLLEPRLAVYECNPLCKCHLEGCKNRVVGKGIRQRLQVFRCPEPGKGWGVRCLDPIPAGTFVFEYIGELVTEMSAEKRGRRDGDEYLFSLDMFASDMARLRLEQYHLKIQPETEGALVQPFEPSVPPRAIQPSFFCPLMDEMVRVPFPRLATALPAHQRPRHDRGGQRSHEASGGESSEGDESSVGSSEGVEATARRVLGLEGGKAGHADRVLLRMLTGWESDKAARRITRWTIKEMEQACGLVIDARRYGNVARFVNHSCDPNLYKQVVFTDNQDVRRPRVAFFTLHAVPPLTELCYDYGYLRGSVKGRTLTCLCGASECRHTLY